jgi:hypothetical protein
VVEVLPATGTELGEHVLSFLIPSPPDVQGKPVQAGHQFIDLGRGEGLGAHGGRIRSDCGFGTTQAAKLNSVICRGKQKTLKEADSIDVEGIGLGRRWPMATCTALAMECGGVRVRGPKAQVQIGRAGEQGGCQAENGLDG